MSRLAAHLIVRENYRPVGDGVSGDVGNELGSGLIRGFQAGSLRLPFMIGFHPRQSLHGVRVYVAVDDVVVDGTQQK